MTIVENLLVNCKIKIGLEVVFAIYQVQCCSVVGTARDQDAYGKSRKQKGTDKRRMARSFHLHSRSHQKYPCSQSHGDKEKKSRSRPNP